MIATNHAAALRSVPEVALVGACDLDLQRARGFASEHGIPHATDDVGRLLDLEPDLVSVCTPHPVHEANVLACAARGVHVLCEKPLAVHLEEADRMVQATDRAGVLLAVAFQRRLWPSAQRVRRALDEGRLGPPVTGSVLVRLRRDAHYYADPWRGRWDTDGGGVLMTQAIHHLDLLQWFVGPVRRVTARVATLRHTAEIEVEDTAVATLEHASGALSVVQASTTFEPGLGAQVLVSDAAGRTASVLELPEGVGSNDVWTVPGQKGRDSAPAAPGDPDLPLDQVHRHLLPYHQLLVEDVVDAVRHGRPPVVTGRDARASLAIVQAVYASSRTGQAVEVD